MSIHSTDTFRCRQLNCSVEAYFARFHLQYVQSILRQLSFTKRPAKFKRAHHAYQPQHCEDNRTIMLYMEDLGRARERAFKSLRFRLHHSTYLTAHVHIGSRSRTSSD